jgi:chromate reductase
MSAPTIALLVGSLSSHSINHRLALAIGNTAIDRLDFDPISIGDLPLYNRDLDTELPGTVLRLKRQIKACDGILIVTPEYNRSLPSALKNALDWGSRPYGESAWQGKVAAIAGASSGAIGTAIAQSHLRIILTHLDIVTLPQPELYLRVTDELIDANGKVLDQQFQALLHRFVDRLVSLVTTHV